MPPPSEVNTNTPLPPSVEKAYYRKCIELKRRLNEVEEANDVARLRRARLDRAILKLRLERAFLLEQLSRRMDYVDEDEADEVGESVVVPAPPPMETNGSVGPGGSRERNGSISTPAGPS